MRNIIKVHQDYAVQVDSKLGVYRSLHPTILESSSSDKSEELPKSAESEAKTQQYTEYKLEPGQEIVYESEEIENCRVVFIRDIETNQSWMLHISPFACARSYDELTRISEPQREAGFGLFGDFTTSLVNFLKPTPAFSQLDPAFYNVKNIGIEKNAKIEVLVVLPHQSKDKGLSYTAQQEIQDLLKKRLPVTPIKTTIIHAQVQRKDGDTYKLRYSLATDTMEIIPEDETVSALRMETYINPIHNPNPVATKQSILAEAVKEQYSLLSEVKGYLPPEIEIILNPPSHAGLLKEKEGKILEGVQNLQKLLLDIESIPEEFRSNLESNARTAMIFSYLFLGDYDKALEQCLKISPTQTQVQYMICEVTGAIFESKKDYEKALNFYQKLHDLREKNNPNSAWVVESYINIARIYEKMSLPAVAEEFYERAMYTIKQIQNGSRFRFRSCKDPLIGLKNLCQERLEKIAASSCKRQQFNLFL